jgi:flagellar basal-body rod modification protein FlgD
MQVNPTNNYTTDFMEGSDGFTRVPSKMMDQEDFLKLLVTQMTSQDPMNPKADLDSIAQMAQFSTLEQSKASQNLLEVILAEQQVTQATNMIGRNVTLQLDDETTLSGTVESVKFEADGPKIVVEGESYSLSQISSINPVPVPTETE